MKLEKLLELGIGITCITIALVPTPDDVTVVSPLGQAGLGGILVADAFGVKLW